MFANGVNTVQCYGLWSHCTDSVYRVLFFPFILALTVGAVNIFFRSQVFVDSQREVTCITH